MKWTETGEERTSESKPKPEVYGEDAWSRRATLAVYFYVPRYRTLEEPEPFKPKKVEKTEAVP